MRAPRVPLVALALLVCAWFALGAVQAHDQNRATALIDQTGTPSPGLTARILHLLDSAGTLNPDRSIALLRSQAQTRAGEASEAIASALGVVRAEPRNADGWVVLGFAARRADPRLASLAQQRLRALVPPVATAP